MDKMGIKALSAASLGSFGEIYDFAVFGFSVPIIAKQFFPSTDPAAGILSTLAVYGMAFFARPLGGLTFGYLADRIGRVRVMALTIWLMAGSTALIGAVPSYSTIGLAAPILLVVCRIAQGFAVGGETTGSSAYLLESAPDRQRGLWMGIMWFFANLPNAAVALMLGLLQFVSGPALYADWLWRVPFLTGGLIGVVGFWLRRSLDEPDEFKAAVRQHHGSPLLNAIRSGRRPMLYVFVVQPLHSVAAYLLLGFMYTFLVSHVRLDPTAALVTNAFAVLTMSVVLPLSGWMSDHLGRKPLLSIGALWIGVTAYPALHLASMGSVGGALAGQMLVAIGVGLYGGTSFTAAPEFFPTAFRATGLALSYQVAVAAFGGSTPFVVTWLISTYGSPMLPGGYVAAMALVILVAVQFLPETRGSSLRTASGEPTSALDHPAIRTVPVP